MLRVDKFSARDDCLVIKPFNKYGKNDIIPSNTIHKNRLITLWIKGYIRNLNSPKYTKESLEKYSFLELKDIGAKFGVTDRSKKKLIEEILLSQ